VIRHEKERKGIWAGKKVVKLSLFTDGMLLYLKDHKDSTKNLLDLMNTFSKTACLKINIKNQWISYIPIINKLKKKSGKQNCPQYPQNTKHLGIEQNKGMKECYRENCKMLKKLRKTSENGKTLQVLRLVQIRLRK
jgi:hypothetical protein